MNRLMNTLSTSLLVVAASLLLVNCSSPTDASADISPVAFETSDQCHLCGMMISQFPGPKGESFSKDQQQADKFCSTRDLFGYYLQPENQHRAVKLYVHDMSQSPWDAPDDKHLIDAKTAYYVWGSEKTGAMGATLASFGSQMAAEAFAESFGGKVYRFEEITLEMISKPMTNMSSMKNS